MIISTGSETLTGLVVGTEVGSTADLGWGIVSPLSHFNVSIVFGFLGWCVFCITLILIGEILRRR